MYIKHMVHHGYSINVTSHPSVSSYSNGLPFLPTSLVNCTGLWGYSLGLSHAIFQVYLFSPGYLFPFSYQISVTFP